MDTSSPMCLCCTPTAAYGAYWLTLGAAGIGSRMGGVAGAVQILRMGAGLLGEGHPGTHVAEVRRHQIRLRFDEVVDYVRSPGPTIAIC